MLSRLPAAIKTPAGWVRLARYHSHATTCQASKQQAETPKSAALMVIGNEILNGSIVDTNTPWLAKLLNSRGVDLIRVAYIPDDPEDIANTCLDMRQRVGPDGFVFTSGGIGPTHDDVTYQSIADALGLTLELHQPTVDRMTEHYKRRGVELNEARLRMATLPTPSTVLFTPGLWVPLVVAAGNVHILPGIPRLFSQMIEANAETFRGPQCHSEVLYTKMGEGDVADPLAAVAATHPTVRIGSYPNTSFKKDAEYTVKLQFESRDPDAIAAAIADIKQQLPTFTL